MSTAKRRRGHSLHLDLPVGQFEDAPPVAAVFLILFDVKAGYTIAWKRSIPGLELSESVEFKSLPSGLHNVQEDLIYYVHDDEYAGISAFLNEPAAKSDRNALMMAVGALVPLSQGRLGKIWKHAAALKELASDLVHDISKTQPLEDFWAKHRLTTNNTSPELEPLVNSPLAERVKRKEGKDAVNGQPWGRNRAISSASAMPPPGLSLSAYHPALSLSDFLDTFGPLIFPIYKAALLRKRILLVGQAPVELTCNFVYDISILSGIPSSVSGIIPLEPLPTRLRPLFSVGIHDMQALTLGSHDDGKAKETLSEDGMDYGWVACTTDDILSTKEHLFNVLVTLPARHANQAKEKVWPRMEKRRGVEIRATQRDLRRYHTLRRELRRYAGHNRAVSPRSGGGDDSEQGLLLPIENLQETFDEASSTIDEKLIEPQSWSALAYSSFMWWASAGEQRADLDEEAEHDSALLRDSSYHSDGSPRRPRSSRLTSDMVGTEEAPAGLEVAIIAYFHRLTALIFRTLADVVEALEEVGDGDGDEDGDRDEDERQGSGDQRHEEAVFVTSEDMARMGLDLWSDADRNFVEELVALYWGRKAEVQGARVECCGIRIC